MKRILLYVIAFVPLTLFVACSKDGEQSDKSKTEYNLIRIMEYQWKFGEVSSSGDLYEQYTYDNNRNLVKSETNHYINTIVGRLSQYSFFQYDERNHLIERNDYTLSVLEYKYKYTFNNIDSIATMNKYMANGALSESWEYAYDSQNRLIQAKETYDLFDPYVDDYTYNGNDMTVVRHRVDTGELFGTTQYEYDKYHNLLKETWTNGETGEKDLEIYNDYSYNSDGKISKITCHRYYNKNDLTYKEYTYNLDGTIHRIHVSYSFKMDQSNLDYTYSKI